MHTVASAKALGILGYSVTCRRCSHLSSLMFTGLQDAMTWPELAASRFRCTLCRNTEPGEHIVFPRLGRDSRRVQDFTSDAEREGFVIWGLMQWTKVRR